MNDNNNKKKTDIVTKILVGVLIVLVATGVLAAFAMHTSMTKQGQTLIHLTETKAGSSELKQVEGRQNRILEDLKENDSKHLSNETKIHDMDKCISNVELKIDTANKTIGSVQTDVGDIQTEQKEQRTIMTQQTTLLKEIKEDIKK